MKFRYYIACLMNGEMLGTNSETVAKNYAMTCDAFVVDTETNSWLKEDEEVAQINDAGPLAEEEDQP